MDNNTLNYLFSQINQSELEYDKNNGLYALDEENNLNLRFIWNLEDILKRNNKKYTILRNKDGTHNGIIYNNFIINFYFIDIYTLRAFIYVINKNNKKIKIFNNNFDNKNNFFDLLKFLNLIFLLLFFIFLLLFLVLYVTNNLSNIL